MDFQISFFFKQVLAYGINETYGIIGYLWIEIPYLIISPGKEKCPCLIIPSSRFLSMVSAFAKMGIV
jgi:hypothetical protein